MEAKAVSDIVKAFAEGLPEQIQDRLQSVSIFVFQNIEDATEEMEKHFNDDGDDDDVLIPDDTKGVFLGSPAEEEESEETEEDVIEVDPEGFIVLIADNLSTPEEAAVVLMHEYAHAMGMDEEEVKQAGLGVDESKGDEQPERNSA